MKARSLYAILTLCAALVAALPLVAQDAAGTAAAGPRAVVDEPVYDAGPVSPGDEVRHDFVIRNAGERPLEIVEVRPACGCTVADYDRTIAPGESGKIHAVVDTTGFAGGIAKGLTVLTNDPDNPRLVITVKATVEPAVFLRPGFARFIQPRDAGVGSVEQIVFTSTKDDLEITDVQSPYPFLEVDARPATDDEKQEEGKGKQWVVTLSLDYDAAPIGALADYVRLTTNHPKQKEVTIPVSGFVRPLVVLTPETADFGEVEVAEKTEAALVLKNYAQRDMAISLDTASSLPPGVAVDVEPTKEGREFLVHVTLAPELPAGPFAGTIRLKTDHPERPSIEIPLKGTRL
jgi:hypothetical protein